MKSILFIAMHRTKRSPDKRFRFEQYIPYLAQNGHRRDISYIISGRDDAANYMLGIYTGKLWVFTKSVLTRLRDVIVARKYDTVSVYREILMVSSGPIEAILARSGARMVFDFDDAIRRARAEQHLFVPSHVATA